MKKVRVLSLIVLSLFFLSCSSEDELEKEILTKINSKSKEHLD